MKNLLFVIISGVVGVTTFALIAKKYGSECLP
jgi:hypothetical protein